MNETRIRTLLFYLGCMMLVVVMGCGGEAIDTESVEGVVTFDGTPLADAMVNFSPAVDGEGTPSYGRTDEAGHYVLQTLLRAADAGTTPGEYLVYVSKTETVETGETFTTPEGTGSKTESNQLLPAKYTSAKTSGLTATVTEGRNTFDFDLTSK